MLETARSLVDQIYDAIVDEICDGRIPPKTHLVQERLATRFGVSRQPIQQVMALLKADGMVEELGRRGQFVAPLDPVRMQQHYGVRAALDGWAAKTAAQRIGSDAALRASIEKSGRAALEAGRASIAAGDVAEQVRRDEAFHFALYAASGNPLIASTAEPHWRFLRRAMGGVLRMAAEPEELWRQHGAIFDAVVNGDAEAAQRLAIDHVEHAAARLSEALASADAMARTA